MSNRPLEVVLADFREEPGVIYLYALVDPRFPRTFRYIGVTKDPRTRIRKHIVQPGNGNRKLGDWKLSLREQGIRPQMLLLRAFTSREEAEQVEWRMIQRMQRRGQADCNNQPLVMQALVAMSAARQRRGFVWPSIRRAMEARERRLGAA